MFKSIRPEVLGDNSIILHLSNAAQCDLFVQNYKQRMIVFIERRFSNNAPDIKAIVDQTESEGIIYSDEQKYNYLVSRYPTLKEIRKSFNLDFE